VRHPIAAPVREVAEEAGLVITREILMPLCVSNTMAYGSPYIDIKFRREILDGKPRVLEPDKLEAWAWHPIGVLPKPMFETTTMTLQAMQRGAWRTAPENLSGGSVSRKLSAAAIRH